MKYELGYEICALAFLLVICYHFFKHRQFPSMCNRIFGTVIVFGIADISLDLLGAVTISYPGEITLWVNILINSLFYFTQVTIPALLLVYVLAMTGLLDRRHAKLTISLLVPVVLFDLSLVANAFLGIYFRFDNNFVYEHGPLYLVLFAGCVFYMLATVVLLTIFRKQIMKRQYFTILSFIAIIVASMLIQLLLPHVLLTGVAISLSVTMMYLTLQNPDAMLDTATGAFDRASMLMFISNRLLDKKGYQLISVDIDRMRRINSLFGMNAGNELLNQVSTFLIGHGDKRWVFRFLGDSFVVITRSEAEYYRMLGEISTRLDKPWHVRGMDMMLSATVSHTADTGYLRTVDDVVGLLETSIPELKKHNRGCIKELDRSIFDHRRRVELVEAAVRNAIETGAFQIYLQPIYSLAEHKFTMAEALIRLPDSEIGPISPNEFIPIAEKAGLVTKIDETVIDNVCRFVCDNDPRGTLGMHSVEINLSAAEFLQDQFQSRIADAVKRYGADPTFLTFEITETAATSAQDIVGSQMDSMLANGFSFALDDYGTGYSNISRVISLPFSFIKLDRSMMLSHYENRSNALVFEDTLSMFRRLGKATVVEGVETQEQAELVARLGADFIQGYYYSVPLPVNEFIEFMRNRNFSLQ